MIFDGPLYFLSADAAHNDDYHSRKSDAMNTSHEAENNGVYTYISESYPLVTEVELKELGPVRESVTRVKNTGSDSVCIDTLSSGYVAGIGKDGKNWEHDRFVIHVCHSSWQGEGQWKQYKLEDTGLYPTYNHNTQRSYRIGSVGSWSTCRYYPLLILEDKATEEAWFFEIAHGASWMIEICVGGYRNATWLNVMLSACCQTHDGWHRQLLPGEEYTAPKAVYGCVPGGFEEAVGVLLEYKRSLPYPKFPRGPSPVCFNDYMNCLWALPTREKLIPLIDAAANAGCEYFIIDAGWFGPSDNWNDGLGDYIKNDDKFGPGGFAGILEYIKEKGMEPGCWLEIESATASCEFVKANPDCILTRYGKPVGKTRCFLDFRKSAVTEHIFSVFEGLYSMGIRFIKNDYNQNTGIGIDGPLGQASAEELKLHHKAVMALIDRVRAAFPDLIIENCSSGCMRADGESEVHFHLQSCSDQEYYDRMPSIVQGLSACLIPERTGIWGYPYPVPIDERMSFVKSEEFTQKFASGQCTVFNMVNMMSGGVYLSGHIDCADETGMELIREGIDVYKSIRHLIPVSRPVYPTKIANITHRGLMSLGLLSQDALLLSLWNTSDKDRFEIDLTKYLTLDSKIELVYPRAAENACRLTNGVLEFDLPRGPSAMWLRISIGRVANEDIQSRIERIEGEIAALCESKAALGPFKRKRKDDINQRISELENEAESLKACLEKK